MADPFKERLLVALKEEVASREPARPARSHRRKYALAAGFAAVVAGAAIVGVPMLGEDPAYAVEREPDGTIKVKAGFDIEPADAAAIQRKLEFFGVPAVVDLLRGGEDCAGPRGAYVGDEDGSPPDGFITQTDSGFDDDDWSHWNYRIDPSRLEPGQTLVWEIHTHGEGDSKGVTGDVWIVEGPVRPCEIVPGDF
ncbi:hypothetical protein [Phytomonospora endophytica]|uniref:Uncharacterized protein n=1 Tax=Phytomonospora endophytica TaxID=714109 RepID=A0A841FSM1_9ACTN|nr:hypothetical protein [Phytomonospora endophytica]MBB6039036.1 hypothetical protein [Phytomonospora endophytica]GIG69514.1 hypothetical protein Pen01_58090 [Phytomonospora endophytica]